MDSVYTDLVGSLIQRSFGSDSGVCLLSPREDHHRYAWLI